MLLRDALWPKGEKDWKPLVVACANCQMTMWATSENAHLDKRNEYIYCTDCLSSAS